MFPKTKLCASLLVAFGGSLMLGIPAAQAQETQRVEITGSAIKRTSVEGPAPIEVVTRKDIEKTGATSLNELLRSIPSIDIFDQGELTSNSPSGSGTANVALRGLSSSETLVLLNGRRMPVNALYDSSGAGAAFDINSLPIGVIERIEILKDGGSAIYGADAVAGVINFITKTDYQGIEATASYGVSSRGDGTEKRVGLSAGFGDLSKDGYNVLVGIDVFKRDPILRKDRDISKSVDYSRFGSRDGRSGFSPQGNVIDPNSGALVGVTYRDCPPENLDSLGICRYDFNASLLTAYNGADRFSGLVLGTVAINPDVKAFAEVIYSQSKDHFEAHPVPDYFVVPILNDAQRPYAIEGTDSIYIAGRFMQGGPRITDRKSEFYNAAVGLEGFSYGLDWKVNLSHGQSKVTNSDRNYYDLDKWTEATTTGLLDPTVDTNDPAFVESLKVRPQRIGKSELTTLNAQVGGDLFTMPGGMTKYAVGVSFNKEKLTDTPDPLTQQGLVVGSIQQAAVSADRNFSAVYGELSIPILKTLEGQLALRYDRYPGTSKTSPKVGLKYTPTQALAFRGSYTESFRAPVLKQLFGAQEQGAITLTRIEQCQGLGVPLITDPVTGEEKCFVQPYQVGGSNPDLKPEKGKTYNLGVIFDIDGRFNASIDWWKIKKTDEISTPSIQQAIDDGNFYKDGARYYILTTLQNFAQREVSGVDFDARFNVGTTPLGKVSLRNLLTYYASDRTRGADSDPWDDYLGTYAKPRFRNAFSAATEYGPWTVAAAWRTVGGFYDSDLTFPEAKLERKVGTHEEMDLQVQYAGITGWELTAGVKNLFDRQPPFSATNGTDNTYSQQGFAELYSSRGRFFYVGAKYAFR